VAPLALVKQVVEFDFQALLSFDRLQARVTSTKSRPFIHVATNGSFSIAGCSGVDAIFVNTSAFVGTNRTGELITSGLPVTRDRWGAQF
jgi:hypothetical protein